VRRHTGEHGVALLVVLAAVFSLALGAPAASATTASLGDSYSSGEGAGPFDAGTQKSGGNGCDRSSNAWPRLLGVPEENHFACSGAKTIDFYETKKESTSQLERLRALAARESISKVYVTIGGNDLGFASIIKSCVIYDCLRHMGKKELPKLHDHVRPAVTKALQETKAAAAGGQVIMVGYPNLIPSNGSQFVNCGWLTDAEKVRVWKLEDSLDTALSEAASNAGVSFVSIGDSLKGHELCTHDSWMNPVASAGVHGGGHPNAVGQKAIADAVRSAEDTGAGAVPPPPAGCVPADNIAAIVDDSGSMEENDPLKIRSSAMQLLLTKPGGQSRTLGAVEFGTDAGPLFDPGVISVDQAGMLASLSALQDDGFFEGGGSTDYNTAFAASKSEQPSATARIFLTDGGHNVGAYEDGHVGGPRTYVVGLNIGPAGEGDANADLLGRIAGDTGGAYFPLLRSPGDSAETQSTRIQPVFNAIDALLQCHGAPEQTVRTLDQPNDPAPPFASRFQGAAGLEVVLSWTTPNTQVTLASAAVRNAGGRIIANLTGKRPQGRHHRKKKGRRPALLQPSTVQGPTFQTITVPRPRHGSSLAIAVTAPALSGATTVSIQVSPVQSLPQPAGPAPSGASEGGSAGPAPSPAGGSSPPSGGGSPPPPPPPANHSEQETPNHPVNTFTNYHNASGLGPPIAAGQWVEVSCRVYDPTIASVNPDGYWYRIASSPWNNGYYSPANTFMNGDPYGGPYTHNTDFAVPVC
jgi:lysophospholipase L1-like esterase